MSLMNRVERPAEDSNTHKFFQFSSRRGIARIEYLAKKIAKPEAIREACGAVVTPLAASFSKQNN